MKPNNLLRRHSRNRASRNLYAKKWILRTKILITILAAGILSACGKKEDVPLPAPPPTVVNATNQPARLLLCGRTGNTADIGLINLIYNLARSEQIVRLKLRPQRAA